MKKDVGEPPYECEKCGTLTENESQICDLCKYLDESYQDDEEGFLTLKVPPKGYGRTN
jgi:hypothetical protein